MIAFEAVRVDYRGGTALAGVTLEVPQGALCVLVGPSGSGKSTLLRLVNRLIVPTAGRVRVRGADIATLEPTALRRSIGYAIQSVGLFPHRSVAENIATVPRLLGWNAARIEERVAAMLALVRLDPALAGRRPDALSGGQAQRVGLARALAADPDILLMDEPFGAVDPLVRAELRAELRLIHAATGKTIVLVTHDPAEALELATLLVVLRDGCVVAAGAPLALTEHATDPFVRSLLGGEELALRRLTLVPVRQAMSLAAAPGAPGIEATASLHAALTRMAAEGTTLLQVCDVAGAPIGSVALGAIIGASG